MSTINTKSTPLRSSISPRTVPPPLLSQTRFRQDVQRVAQWQIMQLVQQGKLRVVSQESQHSGPHVYTPRMNLIEDRSLNKSTAIFEIPGVKTNDMSLQIREGKLLVRGERRPPQSVQAAQSRPKNPVEAADSLAAGDMDTDAPSIVSDELRFGSFVRTINVPEWVKESDVSASLQDGMLTVTWPIFLTRTASATPLATPTPANINAAQ